MIKMTSLLLLFTSFIALDVNASSAPSISELQSPPMSIASYGQQILFPRDYNHRYRGQESELFTLDSALRAFFGDKTATIESLEYSSINLILQNRWWPTKGEDKAKMHRMRKYFCKNWNVKDKSKSISNHFCYNLHNTMIAKNVSLQDELQSLMKKKSKYTIREASMLTQKILNKKFTYESNSVKRSRLLDYNSSSYQDFPSDVLFSTVFQQNAMIYGDSIIVIAPHDNRSLDLSYYNGVNNSRWGYAADAGEYITPGFIQSNEITGIHLRVRAEYPDKIRNQVRIKTYEIQKHLPISYAFYKVNHNNKTYVLIFDGKRGQRDTYCITRSSNTFNHCRWADPMYNNGVELLLAGNQPLGKVQKYVPNLIGVLALDEVGNPSSRPTALINKFKYFSDQNLDINLKNSLGVGEQAPIDTINSFRMNIKNKIFKLQLFRANN